MSSALPPFLASPSLSSPFPLLPGEDPEFATAGLVMPSLDAESVVPVDFAAWLAPLTLTAAPAPGPLAPLPPLVLADVLSLVGSAPAVNAELAGADSTKAWPATDEGNAHRAEPVVPAVRFSRGERAGSAPRLAGSVAEEASVVEKPIRPLRPATDRPARASGEQEVATAVAMPGETDLPVATVDLERESATGLARAPETTVDQPQPRAAQEAPQHTPARATASVMARMTDAPVTKTVAPVRLETATYRENDFEAETTAAPVVRLALLPEPQATVAAGFPAAEPSDPEPVLATTPVQETWLRPAERRVSARPLSGADRLARPVAAELPAALAPDFSRPAQTMDSLTSRERGLPAPADDAEASSPTSMPKIDGLMTSREPVLRAPSLPGLSGTEVPAPRAGTMPANQPVAARAAVAAAADSAPVLSSVSTPTSAPVDASTAHSPAPFRAGSTDTAQFAAPLDFSSAGRVNDRKGNFQSTPEQMVKSSVVGVGINQAHGASDMSHSVSNLIDLPVPTDRAAAILRADVSRFLERVELIAERVTSRDSGPVEVKIEVQPGEEVGVRLALHAGRLQATIRTANLELREALTGAWNDFRQQQDQRSVRWAEPVFQSPHSAMASAVSAPVASSTDISAAPVNPAGTTFGDAGGQRQRQPEAQADSRTFSGPAPIREPAKSVSGAPAAEALPSPRSTSSRLHVFA